MITYASSSVLWFFGMDAGDARLIRETAGAGYVCRVLDGLSLEELDAILESGDTDDPLMLWLGGQAWRELTDKRPETARLLQLVPTVLVLAPEPCRETLELALDAHMQQVIRAPFGAAQVFDALSRAREARNLYHDMDRMSREIVMGRELLERKSDVCSLLFRFFALTSEAADAPSLLAACARCLAESFPVEGLHAAWWGENGPTVFFLGTDRMDRLDRSDQAETWLAFLRARAGIPLSAKERPGEKVICLGELAGEGKTGGAGGPETGQVVMLRLEVRGQTCGVLALHFRDAFLSGRDVALAFDAVRRHLALVLWEGASRREFFADSPRLEAKAQVG